MADYVYAEGATKSASMLNSKTERAVPEFERITDNAHRAELINSRLRSMITRLGGGYPENLGDDAVPCPGHFHQLLRLGATLNEMENLLGEVERFI